MACANAVTFDSGTCDQNVASPPQVVCNNVCIAYANSVIAAIRDPITRCNYNHSEISNFTQSFNGTCLLLNSAKYDPYFGIAGKCVAYGNALESKTCGFTTLSDARAYCAQKADDACCSLVAGVQIPATTTSAVTAASTNPNRAPSVTISSAATTPSPTITPAALGAITTVILLVIFVAVAAACYYIRRKHRRRPAVISAISKANPDDYGNALSETRTSSTTDRSTAQMTSAVSGQNTPRSIYNSQSSVANSFSHATESFSVRRTPQPPPMPPINRTLLPAIHNPLPPSTNPTDATFGVFWRVVTAYNPQMEDEIVLLPGELVLLDTIY
ncbi:hypothetical protein HK101_011631, partial [Irineochytrium annulatum]